ncbi:MULTISPECIES: hypothetical protein [unclassified Natrinema]|uniref:hypothetical protein n=1 Tax=unclassified Natrinema TaxID=2622230 RepID=UPI00026D4427|nr:MULTISPECIES: hypothetical protein [unclassified Natrinema]AFO56165.1 hypothetical protein NJ7G_0916 [Natrinema sp. J7-2]
MRTIGDKAERQTESLDELEEMGYDVPTAIPDGQSDDLEIERDGSDYELPDSPVFIVYGHLFPLSNYHL